MKEPGYVSPAFRLGRVDPSTAPQKISYSQWSMYQKCPKQWELAYIKKLAPFTNSIHTTFGTAFHEVLQKYLTIMYTQSVKKADEMDFTKELTDNLKREYITGVEQNGAHFSTAHELSEFAHDGLAILDWFKKRRRTYFSTKDVELIGIELDLCVQASEKNPNVFWYGFLDIVLWDTALNKLFIIDIKTSTRGWNKYQKADKLKLAQLTSYKIKFSEQFGIPVDDVDVQFFIVKRKIDPNSMYPQKRVQIINPSSGSVTRKALQKQIDKFVETCFDEAGERIADKEYPAITGVGSKHCKWCPFKQDFKNCPKENRKKE